MTSSLSNLRQFGGALFAAVLLFFALTACDRQDDGKKNAVVSPPEHAKPMRIASLAPAITQMVVDLGKGPSLVGVSEHDDAAPAGLPVVGNFVDINSEALLAARPTHVVMMVGKAGTPARLREMAIKGRFQLIAYQYPDTIADVLKIVYEEGHTKGKPSSLGETLGCVPQAKATSQKMVQDLTAIQHATKSDKPPRVLIAIGLSPLMASGNNTVLNELLVNCGGFNVAAGERVSAPTFDREKILALAPDVILVISPNAPPLKSVDEDSRLAELRGLDIPAVKNGRVVLISDPLAFLPGTNLGNIGAQIARAVWPSRVQEIDAALRSASPATTQPTGAPRE